MPCRWGFRLCLFHLIYTVRPCLIHTCHATPMPRPCHTTTMSIWKRLLKATAQRGMGAALVRHGMCKLASAVQRRHVGDLLAFGFFRLPRGFPRRLLSEAYQFVKIQDYQFGYFPLPRGLSRRTRHCRRIEGRSMACVNQRGTAWQGNGVGTTWSRHGRGMACVN
jgi:hypothetical protein